jgi:RNA polymerase sigma-70 factor, ECF subfamily
LRAYDFRSEWDDVIQDVVMSTDRAVSEGRVKDSTKLLAYIRATTRNRFIDSFRRRRRRDKREQPLEDLELDTGVEHAAPIEVELSVRDALERLPPRARATLVAVYVEGQTYDEAAEQLEIPLGSLKRFLQQGLTSLRRQLLPPEAE